ncbi:putative Zn finger-like uncharacterized protein [Paucibacter oligotrophus]|uniref:Putative Zn finger-like uncharacterized protein n=1 Tax=Roseateles oligotrophus TaxID=1769250 RepID=A0A840LGF4_9BURK|nr:zinc-ribbon and DUF3426 domain-containing protein [Roseateles oligotrophus]MBB4845298.1 putative Zn finger-like uncharacterized protein [Roseateles oligotrophus]
MSLATRCTACGTIFRVVQDQLRISDGYVRCGRCAEVFDAGEQLFDIDREAPPPWPAAAQDSSQELPPAHIGFEPGPQASTSFHAPTPPGHAPWHQEEEDVLPAPEELEVIRAKAQAQHSSWAEADVLDSEHPGQPPAYRPAAEPAFADSRLEPQWFEGDDQAPTPPAAVLIDPPLADDKPDVVLSKSLSSGLASKDKATKDDAAGEKPAKTIAAATPRGKTAATEQAPAAADTAEASLPEFLRKPASGGAWQRRPVRLVTGFACGLLIAGLGVQLLQHFHDAIATVAPASRPALQAYCQLTGCQIKPWQRIEQMVVESTALSQLSPGSNGNHYQLAISLRNKSRYELATPWVELSLTNASGALVGRRMLSPAEFRLNPPAASAPGLAAAAVAASAASAASAAAPSGKHESIAAGSELPLQILLSTGEQRVSGYSVEIFYP